MPQFKANTSIFLASAGEWESLKHWIIRNGTEIEISKTMSGGFPLYWTIKRISLDLWINKNRVLIGERRYKNSLHFAFGCVLTWILHENICEWKIKGYFWHIDINWRIMDIIFNHKLCLWDERIIHNILSTPIYYWHI